MKNKPILCPQRLRHVPHQFSWIDQRLVRDRHIKGRSPQALALYLFLCTVADAQGVSYYSDSTAAGMLGFESGELRAARRELKGAGLIAFSSPFYQILSLDLEKVEAGPPEPRGGEERSIGEVLRSMMEAS